jgi:hypothetical protein
MQWLRFQRAAFEFINDSRKNFIVHFIQAVLVNVERGQGMMRNFYIHRAVAFDLSKVPARVLTMHLQYGSAAASAGYFK